MKRMATWMFLLAAGSLWGAGPGRADEPRPSAQEATEMKGIDLFLHSSRPTFGDIEAPTFSVHADSGKRLDDSRVSSFENAHAIIYRKEEGNLALVAKSMIVDEVNKTAQMAGGVRVTSGRLVVDVEELSWDDTARIARSESTATLDDGSNRISGRSIVIYPDTDRIELGSGSATVQLAEVVEKKAPAADKAAHATQFESIEIKSHQGFSGNFAGQIREIKGPAHLVIIGKEAADTMSVNADLVTFRYAKPEDTMPAEMLFKGRVEFIHSQGTFHADEAAVDLAAGKVRFRGNVTIASEQIRGARTRSFDLDLNTREFVMGPGEVESFTITPAADAPVKKP
jgi:hypothetical protein